MRGRPSTANNPSHSHSANSFCSSLKCRKERRIALCATSSIARTSASIQDTNKHLGRESQSDVGLSEEGGILNWQNPSWPFLAGSGRQSRSLARPPCPQVSEEGPPWAPRRRGPWQASRGRLQPAAAAYVVTYAHMIPRTKGTKV